MLSALWPLSVATEDDLVPGRGLHEGGLEDHRPGLAAVEHLHLVGRGLGRPGEERGGGEKSGDAAHGVVLSCSHALCFPS